MFAESNRGKSPNSRANLRPCPENLKRGGKKPREIITPQEKKFCAHLILTGHPYRAAAFAGYHPSYGAALARRPAIKHYLAKIDDGVTEKVIDSTVEKFVLTREFLDTELAIRLVEAKTHKFRGDADIMKGIEIGFKAVGAIAPNSVSVNAKAGAQAVAQNQLTARRLFLPEWRKEAIRRLEADDERSDRGTEIPAGK